MIKQQEKAFRESVTLLDDGMRLFPLNDQLKLCQGINHMNLGEFQSALGCFEGVRDSNPAEPYIKECWKVLETMG